MLKVACLTLATVIGVTAVAPSIAHAIDNGPCDHCTMDPIVVKGDRPKKEKSQTSTQQLQQTQQPQTAQTSTVKIKRRN